MNEDKRAEALRLAKEAIPADNAHWLEQTPRWIIFSLDDLVRLIALARASAAPQEPPHGWVMVPREPTLDMVVAMSARWITADGGSVNHSMECIYRAMLAAAPQPQAPSATSDDVRAALADARDKAQTADARLLQGIADAIHQRGLTAQLSDVLKGIETAIAAISAGKGQT